jgi:glutaredoxin-like protein
MPFMNESDRAAVKQRLDAMVEPVQMLYFTQELECQQCRETRALLEEVSDLSDKLSLTVKNFQIDKDEAARYGADKIPATVLIGDRDRGVRFYGIPAGYEFVSLLEAILALSKRDSGLAPETRAKLAALSEPVHLQVFVTPT